MDKKTKYPEIEVELLGQSGDAFAILGKVRRALSAAEISVAEVKQFTDEAMSGSYDNLLVVVMNWVTITGPKSSTIAAEDAVLARSDILEEESCYATEDDFPF